MLKTTKFYLLNRATYPLLALFIWLLPHFAKAQYLWQVYPDTIIEWRYQDGDEFSWGIDKNKWHLGFPWGDKIFTQRTYVSHNNIEEKDGVLSFTIKKSDTLMRLHPYEIDTASFRKNKLSLVDSSRFRFLYSGGLLWSKRSYQFGYYELKFKGIEGQEIWPAFWLYGGQPNYEIDFFELKGEQPSDLHVDIHCPDGCRNYPAKCVWAARKLRTLGET